MPMSMDLIATMFAAAGVRACKNKSSWKPMMAFPWQRSMDRAKCRLSFVDKVNVEKRELLLT
jgi:hypothetical protein